MSDDNYVRECCACRDVQLHSLPAVRKKVIYLDQWVWSRMKQALRRLRNGVSLTEQDEVFREMFVRLDRLVKLMLVVCPVSPVHEAESRGLIRANGANREADALSYADMRRLHGHLSGGTRFEPTWRVLSRQVQHTLPLWLNGTLGPLAWTPVTDAVAGKINVWLPLLYGAYDHGFSVAEITLAAEISRQLSARLQSVAERWRAESDLKFEDWFKQETAGHARFLENIGSQPFTHDPRAMIWRSVLEATDPAGDAGQTRAREFMTSPAFRALPLVRISAALWAGLAHRTARGGQREIASSSGNDVEFISTYLPYCDAMIIERSCCDLLLTAPVRDFVPEAERVFVTRSTTEFISYLADLENAVDTERRALVADIYGEDWNQPDLSHFFA